MLQYNLCIISALSAIECLSNLISTSLYFYVSIPRSSLETIHIFGFTSYKRSKLERLSSTSRHRFPGTTLLRALSHPDPLLATNLPLPCFIAQTIPSALSLYINADAKKVLHSVSIFHELLSHCCLETRIVVMEDRLRGSEHEDTPLLCKSRNDIRSGAPDGTNYHPFNGTFHQDKHI